MSRTFVIPFNNALTGAPGPVPTDPLSPDLVFAQPTPEASTSLSQSRCFYPYGADPANPFPSPIDDLGYIDPVLLWGLLEPRGGAPDDFIASIGIESFAGGIARVELTNPIQATRIPAILLANGVTRYNLPLMSGDGLRLSWQAAPAGPSGLVVVTLWPVDDARAFCDCMIAEEEENGGIPTECTTAAANASFAEANQTLDPAGIRVGGISIAPPVGLEDQFELIVEEGNQYFEALCNVTAEISAHMMISDATNPPVASPGSDVGLQIVADSSTNPTTVRGQNGATIAPFDTGAGRQVLSAISVHASVELQTGDRIGLLLLGPSTVTNANYNGGISIVAAGCCSGDGGGGGGGDGDGDGDGG